MAIFQTAARQFAQTPSQADDRCPVCEQRIPNEKANQVRARFEAWERERRAAVEAKAREEGKKEAEARLEARLAAFQEQLAAAQAEKTAARQQIEALKEAQEAMITQRLGEMRAALQKEREAAVLAEKAKVLKLQSELQDLQRKLESKTAHELGEGAEIDLFEELKAAFEGDRIRRVSKGVNGADVIHEVLHKGKVCGKIIYDSKNRNAWQNEFVAKLRADKLAERAEHAILASNKFPKGAQQIHVQDDVIVAHPARIVAIAEILRRNLLLTHELRVSGEEREQKTVALYAFITSEHCRQLLDTIESQASKISELDVKEQEAHRRVWDQRAKLLRSVQKARSDLSFEIERIIGTAGNGPEVM
jgi:hypothetical protein